MSSALIGLGSNLGDRIHYLRQACEQLDTHPAVHVVAVSSLYETPPVGPPQGTYLNACVRIETSLSPFGLLRLCQGIERAGKRKRTVHWGPRTIDLDLLDFDGQVIDTPQLRLPHPGIVDRMFVLGPLADVAPEWRHPVTDLSVSDAIARIRATSEPIAVVALANNWCRIRTKTIVDRLSME